jgi:hypothetical protein
VWQFDSYPPSDSTSSPPYCPSPGIPRTYPRTYLLLSIALETHAPCQWITLFLSHWITRFVLAHLHIFYYVLIPSALASIRRYYVTSLKVVGSIPDYIIGFFNWPNLSSRTMAPRSIQTNVHRGRVKRVLRIRVTTSLLPLSRLSRKHGGLDASQPYGHSTGSYKDILTVLPKWVPITFLEVKVRQARKDGNLAAICEQTLENMGALLTLNRIGHNGLL